MQIGLAICSLLFLLWMPLGCDFCLSALDGAAVGLSACLKGCVLH